MPFSKARYSATVRATFGVVRQVDEHGDMVENAALAEGALEILCDIVFYAHGCEDNGEFLVRIVTEGRLHDDLRGQLVVWKSVSGEDRKLLTADQGHQSIDGGNSGADVVSRIFTGNRV